MGVSLASVPDHRTVCLLLLTTVDLGVKMGNKCLPQTELSCSTFTIHSFNQTEWSQIVWLRVNMVLHRRVGAGKYIK